MAILTANERSGRPAARRTATPFLRWAGGKRWLIRELHQLPRRPRRTYFEPFLGSGAVFFALRPKVALLSDINGELIAAYRVVRDRLPELLEELSALENTIEVYERVRATVPRDLVSRAARLIYLNKTAWNGLYRVNSSDCFNVPYGHDSDRDVVNAPGLRAASESLQTAVLRTSPFSTMLSKAGPGDLIYADPPYVTNGSEQAFHLYDPERFSWAAQRRLASALRRVDRAGARFLLSNGNDPSIRSLYEGFEVHVLHRSSVIAGDPKHRRRVTELLISNFPVRLAAETDQTAPTQGVPS